MMTEVPARAFVTLSHLYGNDSDCHVVEICMALACEVTWSRLYDTGCHVVVVYMALACVVTTQSERATRVVVDYSAVDSDYLLDTLADVVADLPRRHCLQVDSHQIQTFPDRLSLKQCHRPSYSKSLLSCI